MFFLLTKTLGVLLLPTNFLIGLGILGAVLLATRWARLGRGFLIASVILLAVCGFSPLGKLLVYSLEQRFPPWEAAKATPDGIVVLGGPIDTDVSMTHGRAVIGASGDRIVAAAALAHRYPNARLLYTGGSANLLSNDAREADYATELFESLGIAKARLLIERHARNTQENAEFSKTLAAPKPGECWLLLTSAYHMPRSVGLFRKAGFDVVPYPVDWRAGTTNDLLMAGNLAVDGLAKMDFAVREWMGLIAYRATGRIDELLPGPGPRERLPSVAPSGQSC